MNQIYKNYCFFTIANTGIKNNAQELFVCFRPANFIYFKRMYLLILIDLIVANNPSKARFNTLILFRKTLDNICSYLFYNKKKLKKLQADVDANYCKDEMVSVYLSVCGSIPIKLLNRF